MSETETNEFSVWIFLKDGGHFAEKRFVGAEEALRTLADFTNRPAAKMGVIERVIITDGGDCINFEWQFGKGITYPNLTECQNSN